MREILTEFRNFTIYWGDTHQDRVILEMVNGRSVKRAYKGVEVELFVGIRKEVTVTVERQEETGESFPPKHFLVTQTGRYWRASQ